MLTDQPSTPDAAAFCPTTRDFITAALFKAAEAEARILPAGLFRLRLVRETGDSDTDRMDFVAVDQLRGPPFGAYQVRRERGQFLVLRVEDDDSPAVVFSDTLAGAFEAIRRDLTETWQGAWGLSGEPKDRLIFAPH